MTNTQIKDNNNTLIRTKTVAKSITKTNVADQLDAIVDYVDQEVSVKTVKISISSSELLQLFTTPKIILPNTSGKLKTITSLYFLKSAGTGYTNAYGWQIIDQNGSNIGSSIENSFIIGSANELDVIYNLSNANGGWESVNSSPNLIKNRSLRIKSLTGNLIGGASTLDLFVTYIETSL